MLNTCCNYVYQWNTGNGQLQKPNSTFQAQSLQELDQVIFISTNCNHKTRASTLTTAMTKLTINPSCYNEVISANVELFIIIIIIIFVYL